MRSQEHATCANNDEHLVVSPFGNGNYCRLPWGRLIMNVNGRAGRVRE